MSNHTSGKVWVGITYPFPNSTVQPFNVGNGYVISSHTLSINCLFKREMAPYTMITYIRIGDIVAHGVIYELLLHYMCAVFFLVWLRSAAQCIHMLSQAKLFHMSSEMARWFNSFIKLQQRKLKSSALLALCEGIHVAVTVCSPS